MKPTTRSTHHPDPQASLTDDALQDLRRAHHALEAFQLSAEHQTLKDRLKTRLRQPDSGRGEPDDPKT